MKKQRTETKEYLECDGCQYVIGLSTHDRERGVKLEDCVTTLDVFWDDERVVFHFHGAEHPTRHDCFRYWAHNVHVIQRSLKERGWDDEDIDDFLRVHLYSDPNKVGSPGIPRPMVKK